VFVEKGAPPTRQEGKPMELTDPVKRVLANYESDNPGTKAIRDGGGNGSIIGRNTSQRPEQDASDMLGKIIKICQGRD
jgi:hypothetical protein